MRPARTRRLLFAVCIAVVSIAAWQWTRSAATTTLSTTTLLTVQTHDLGRPFARGAVGFSTETSELGTARLSRVDTHLVRLMRLLGPATIRIGGNSVDSSWWTGTAEPAPAWATSVVTPGELTQLRSLLAATGWRALLGVNLAHFDPARAAQEVQAAQRILGGRLLGVEVGNEPNGYSGESATSPRRAKTYNVSEYVREFEAYRRVIASSAPGVRLDGPAVSGTRWITQLGAAAGVFSEITDHYYYFAAENACAGLAAHALGQHPTVSELLSPASRAQETETLTALAETATLAGRPVRVDETGTGRCNGSSPASPTLASALWALDWSLRAASSGIGGLEFHGRFGACEPENQTPVCAATPKDARVNAVRVRPEYYGLLAASRLEGGRFVPVLLSGPGATSDLVSWATIRSDGTLTIAVENFSTGGEGQAIRVSAPGYAGGRVETLTGSSAQARAGITLGRASLTGAGRWRPRPQHLPAPHDSFWITVHAASAALLTLTPR